MPLPKRIAEDARLLFDRYCRTRIPAELHDQIRLSYEIKGNSLTLIEERPSFLDRERWTRNEIAKFKYDSYLDVWQLFWADRNDRWREYEGIGATPRLWLLLETIDREPHCFWG